jgi:hypothetical protein
MTRDKVYKSILVSESFSSMLFVFNSNIRQPYQNIKYSMNIEAIKYSANLSNLQEEM